MGTGESIRGQEFNIQSSEGEEEWCLLDCIKISENFVLTPFLDIPEYKKH